MTVDDESAPFAGFAGGGERLHEAFSHALAGHLHEPQRGDLSDLMACAIAPQALHKAAQDEVAVRFEHHVDEVNDDDSASCFKIVARHGLLKGASRANELARVDVDDRHRLGAVNDEGAAGGKPHLAIHTLGKLLVDAVCVEDVLRPHPLLDAVGKFGTEFVHVVLDGCVRVTPLDDELGEVLVENVAHHAHRELRLAAQEHRSVLGRRTLLVDLLPLASESSDVVTNLRLGCTLGGGAHDDSGTGGDDGLEDLLQARALLVGQLSRDAHHGATRNEHEVAAREGDLRRQACSLVADRILRHLNQDGVTRLEGGLNAAGLAFHPDGIPVDLSGIQDGVAAATHIDECRLHGRKNVLDAAQVDVTDHGGLGTTSDVVLNEEPVLKDGDLIQAVMITDDHGALDGLAARQELRFGDRVAAPALAPTLAATHLLGLEPGRSLQSLDLIRGITIVRNGCRCRAGTPPTTTG